MFTFCSLRLLPLLSFLAFSPFSFSYTSFFFFHFVFSFAPSPLLSALFFFCSFTSFLLVLVLSSATAFPLLFFVFSFATSLLPSVLLFRSLSSLSLTRFLPLLLFRFVCSFHSFSCLHYPCLSSRSRPLEALAIPLPVLLQSANLQDESGKVLFAALPEGGRTAGSVVVRRRPS